MAINWIEGVLQHSKQTGSDLLLLILLAESADRDTGSCWPGVKTLARLMRSSERTVQRTIQQLVTAGELSVSLQASPYGTNVYTLSPMFSGGDKNVTPHRVTKTSPPPDKNVTPPGDKNVTQGVTRVTPKPSVEPSVGTKKISLSARATEAPAEDDQLIERSRYRDAIFRAHAAAAGLKANTTEFRRRQTEALTIVLPELETAGELPTPELAADMTAYVRAHWRYGGIPTTPTLRKVLDQQAEYEQWHAAWLAAGQPREVNADGTEGAPQYLLLRVQAETRKAARASPASAHRRDGGMTADDLAEWAIELKAEKERGEYGHPEDSRVAHALGG